VHEQEQDVDGPGYRGVGSARTIVAADVVGYSRLMGRDESGTLVRLRAHRIQRFEPILARYGGRLVKLMGQAFRLPSRRYLTI